MAMAIDSCGVQYCGTLLTVGCPWLLKPAPAAQGGFIPERLELRSMDLRGNEQKVTQASVEAWGSGDI